MFRFLDLNVRLFCFKIVTRLRSGIVSRARKFLIDLWFKLTNRQYRLLVRARRDRDVDESLRILNELKFRYPNSVFWTRHLSVIAADLGLIDLAKELGRDYFQSVISADLDVFIDEVRSFLVPILGDVSVEYSYRGGNENIGCIICRSRKEEVLSFGKVIELKRESMRELEFYQAILENFPNLKAVVPKCFGVYYRTSDNIAVIFMDPLAPLGLEKKRIGLPVIEINSFIESVSYNDTKRIFSGISVDYSKPFARIFHLRYGCKYALSEIRLGFPAVVTDEVRQLLHSLETIFLHSGIHEYVNLDKHYSLCHNDFHWRNLHHYDGKCTIFDWGTYSYGMRGWDMAVYFSDGEFSFEEICRMYIDSKFDISDRDDQIFLLYFCFSLILNLSRRHRRNCEPLVDAFFLPALEVIQNMYERLTVGSSK